MSLEVGTEDGPKRASGALRNLETIKGTLDRLHIYQRADSSVWQMRIREPNGKRYKRKSTGTDDKKKAIEVAKNFYRDALVLEFQDKTLFPTRFETIAREYIDAQTKKAGRARVNERKIKEEEKKLYKDIIPYFGRMEINEILPMHLDDYMNEVLYERELSDSTIQKHFITIRHVFKYAVLRNYLKTLPAFPKTSLIQKPRPCFDETDYETLWRTAVAWGDKKKVASFEIDGKPVRGLYYTREFSDFIVFSTNVFVRLSDVKLLQHKHVKIIREGKSRALQIAPPDSKTITVHSHSMEHAVAVYERLTQRHIEEGRGNRPDDYIFYPEHLKRGYFLDVVRRLFNHLLEEKNLKFDSFGNARTLYSLRHTGLMFRFLYMEPCDIFLIARNALTSVAMLEKFYLSQASSRMKLEQLQSKKKFVTD